MDAFNRAYSPSRSVCESLLFLKAIPWPTFEFGIGIPRLDVLVRKHMRLFVIIIVLLTSAAASAFEPSHWIEEKAACGIR